MFTRSAGFYDALYQFKNYAAASQQLHELIQQYNANAKTLLDVACGTGKHLEHLREYYRVEGLDINADLLRTARQRCPEARFHTGNMIHFNLKHKFDVITCLFSSIGYVKLVENLDRTIASMARHLEPGGLLVMEPWLNPETYWTGKITANFVDEPDLKIAWMYTSEIEGKVSIFNINYLVGTPEGVEHFVERHEMGLFTHEEYLGAFQKGGLIVQYDSKGLFGRGVYIGFAR